MKVYITGMGVVSSLGNSVTDLFNQLKENGTGVRFMEDWQQFNGLKTYLGAPAAKYDVKFINRKARRSMSPMSEMATLATLQAMEQAGFQLENPWEGLDSSRMLICMGSTTGSPISFEEHYKKFFERNGPEGQLSTTFFKVMNHSIPSNVATALGFKGPLLSPSSACSTSSQAMILAWELINAGVYDLAIVGGADELHHSSAAIFDIVQAATHKYNDNPDKAPRPFDRDRDGLVVAEGAGIVVLESERSMINRGSKPLAEFLGGSYICDGTHMSFPQKETMETTMKSALKRAKRDIADVGYVNAHATSTVIGDLEEAKAIRSAFGSDVPVSSLKGHLGHSLSACGAIEAICSVKMMEEGVLIPSRNLENPDPECSDMNLLKEPMKNFPELILSNNFAFGGMNTSLLLSPAFKGA